MYDGRNHTFFLVNYEGTRIDRGPPPSTLCPRRNNSPGGSARRSSIRCTGQPFPNNTIPQSRFSRLAQLAIRSNWFPAPNSSAAQGNYEAVRTFPQTQDQFTIRGDQDLGKLGRAFLRYTQTGYENTAPSNLIDPGNRVFVQDTTNWQVSHSWPIHDNLVNQFRIGRVDARADQHGSPVRNPTWTSSNSPGRSPTFRTTSASARASACRGIRAPAARSTRTPRAISRCGTSATRPPGSAERTR